MDQYLIPKKGRCQVCREKDDDCTLERIIYKGKEVDACDICAEGIKEEKLNQNVKNI